MIKKTWKDLIASTGFVKEATPSEIQACNLFVDSLKSNHVSFDTHRGVDPPDWLFDMGNRGVAIEVTELHKQLHTVHGRTPEGSIIEPLKREVSKHLRAASASGEIEVRLIQGPIDGKLKQRVAELMKPMENQIPIAPLIGLSSNLKCGDGASAHQNLPAVVKDAVKNAFDEKNETLLELKRYVATDVILMLAGC